MPHDGKDRKTFKKIGVMNTIDGYLRRAKGTARTVSVKTVRNEVSKKEGVQVTRKFLKEFRDNRGLDVGEQHGVKTLWKTADVLKEHRKISSKKVGKLSSRKKKLKSTMNPWTLSVKPKK